MNPAQKQFSLTGVSLNKANAYHYLRFSIPVLLALLRFALTEIS